MSRHGYQDDLHTLDLGRWRGMVASAIKGRRGQRFFADLAKALDDMPEKRLVSGRLQTKDGDCCALGAVCAVKGYDYTSHEDDAPYELEELNAHLSLVLDIAECLVKEVEYVNDELGRQEETPEQRWERVRKWVQKQIKEQPAAAVKKAGGGA
jgi:hypothetical protein